VAAEIGAALIADAQFAHSLRAHLDDDRLDVDLTAWDVEFGNYGLQRAVILRRGADDQRIGRRVRGQLHTLLEFSSRTSGSSCRPSCAAGDRRPNGSLSAPISHVHETRSAHHSTA